MSSKYLLVWLIVCLICLMPSPLLAQAKAPKPVPPKTVLDYYALLPDRYFEANREQRMHWMLDPKGGAIVDIKNGYLYAAGDGAQMGLTVCLFKKADGTSLIAVYHQDKLDVFESFLDFYVYRNGELRKASKAIMPVAFDKTFHYELPRNGTTITVTNKSGSKLYDLIWNRRVFRLSRS